MRLDRLDMRSVIVKFSVLCLLVGAIAVPVSAQTAPLEENQKAVLAFDLRIDRIVGSELGKSLNLGAKMSEMAAQKEPDGIDPQSLVRVFGAMSAPESMEEAQGIATGSPVVNFFAKMQFKDAESATAAWEKMMEKELESVEHNGKTYYRPPANAKMPGDAVVHQLDATTVEFGSEAFIFHPSQAAVFTDGLTDALKVTPEDQAIRLVFDVEGASGLLAELVEQGKQGGNPMMAGFLDLVDNMKNVRLCLDFSGENLLTLNSTAVDSEQAEELHGGLSGILGMAKMAGGPQVNQMKEQDPATAEVLGQILGSLNAKVEGSEVSLVVPIPEGFDAAVQGAAAKFGFGPAGQ